MKDNFYLISSNDNNNIIKIFSEIDDKIKFSSNKSWINHFNEDVCSFLIPQDEFINENILLGNKIICSHLNPIYENETEDLMYWFNKENFECLFWLLGYNIYLLPEDVILKRIYNYTAKEVLLCLQIIEVLINYYEKGVYFNRFRQLYNHYLKAVKEEEKNRLVVGFVEDSVANWEFI